MRFNTAVTVAFAALVSIVYALPRSAGIQTTTAPATTTNTPLDVPVLAERLIPTRTFAKQNSSTQLPADAFFTPMPSATVTPKPTSGFIEIVGKDGRITRIYPEDLMVYSEASKRDSTPSRDSAMKKDNARFLLKQIGVTHADCKALHTGDSIFKRAQPSINVTQTCLDAYPLVENRAVGFPPAGRQIEKTSAEDFRPFPWGLPTPGEDGSFTSVRDDRNSTFINATPTPNDLPKPDRTVLRPSYERVQLQERTEATARCYTLGKGREPCYWPLSKESMGYFPGSEHIQGPHNLPVHSSGRHGHGSRDASHIPGEESRAKNEEGDAKGEKSKAEGQDGQAEDDEESSASGISSDGRRDENGTAGGKDEWRCPCSGHDCFKRDAAALEALQTETPMEQHPPQPLPTGPPSGPEDAAAMAMTVTMEEQHHPQPTFAWNDVGLGPKKREWPEMGFPRHPRMYAMPTAESARH